jgi:hypothetical protein
MNRLAKVGATALRIYCNHLLVFTAGAIAGGIEVALLLIAARNAGVF